MTTGDDMNPNKDEEASKDIQSTRLEYQECCSLSRFMMGIRFSFFASFVTMSVLLVGAYHYVWMSKRETYGNLQPYLLFLISLFGFLSVLSALTIEMRNIIIADKCDRRAAALEMKMAIEDGIYQQIAAWTKREVNIPFTQPLVIHGVYMATIALWLILWLYSGYFLVIRWMS